MFFQITYNIIKITIININIFINFDIIFTSPLKRARETAEIIRGNRDIPIIDCEDILEISFGEYEGLCFGKENYTIPDKDFMFFFEKPECYKPAPGGETFEEVLERTGRFMQKLIQTEEYQDKTILLSVFHKPFELSSIFKLCC